MTEQGSDDRETTIQGAFSLVGNDVRADILQSLGDTLDDEDRYPLSFSALHEFVDPSMDSSQFNYHLQKLVPTFVTNGEDGYRLHPRGVKLYRAIAAGTFTREEELAPVDADFDCHFCDSPVVGRYENDQFTVRCTYCDHVYARRMLPPSVVDDWRDVLRRVDRSVRADVLTAADGVCPNCLNEMEGELLPTDEAPFDDEIHLDLGVLWTCDNCGLHRFMSVGVAMLGDAAVIAFAKNRGVDVTETPIWELEFAATDDYVAVQSRDPWVVTLSIPIDGDTLKLEIDGDLDVVSSTVE